MTLSLKTRVIAALGLAVACGGDPTGPPDDWVGPGPFASVSGRGFHTCGLTPAGAVHCWGENFDDFLGTGSTGLQPIPAKVAMPAGLTFTSASAGANFTCGLTPGGAAHCWGDNDFGQLGDGTTTDRATPTAVVMPAGLTFTSVSASIPYHVANPFTCGLTPAGTGYCWGGNDQGQLGDGSVATRPTPGPVAAPAGVTFTSLGTGADHACGLTPAGTVYCWGANNEGGQLGDGTTTNRLTPVSVAMPPGVTFAALGVGAHHTCALTPAGAAYCWGSNLRGRLGDGTLTDRPTPTAVLNAAALTFTSIIAGYDQTCALTPAGLAYCWGRNVWGQVGDGTGTNRSVPVAVAMPPGESFTTLTAGWMYACGLTPSGAGYCWGLNNHGQLGDGTTTNRLVPVAVVQQ